MTRTTCTLAAASWRRAAAVLLFPAMLAIMLVAPPALAAGDYSKGLLWRIDGAASRPSYLFGTIHSDDPRVIQLPDTVRQVFEKTESLTLELVPDIAAMEGASSVMLFSDGRTLQDVLGRRLYKRTADAMASYGMPAQAVASMKPWAIMVTLSVPKPRTGLFLDYALYLEAAQAGKPVHSLERLEEQLAVFDDLSMDDQIGLLRETLNGLDKLPEQFEQLVNAYLQRDLARLVSISEQYVPTQSLLGERLMERLLDKRNERMFERMQPQLREGNSFIAVGALHLAGPEGLLEMLARAGYRVTPVY